MDLDKIVKSLKSCTNSRIEPFSEFCWAAIDLAEVSTALSNYTGNCMKPSVGIGTYITGVPEIASEIFDGELVIANYESGLYYSISVEGCWIWQGLAHGLIVSQVVEWLSGHFPGQASELVTPVEDFIAKLVAEGLILEASTSNRALSELPTLAGEVFAQPVIERFDDLQQLLLLDPVHDVDQAGWPRRPAD